MPLTSVSKDRLSKLSPELAKKAVALAEACDKHGVNIQISQGLRTIAEQDALYAKGRTVAPIGKQFTVTNAKGGSSWHNYGLAFDIVVMKGKEVDWSLNNPGWKIAATEGKALGLEWGGDWKGITDVPHFQSIGKLTLAEARKLVDKGLPAVWAVV